MTIEAGARRVLSGDRPWLVAYGVVLITVLLVLFLLNTALLVFGLSTVLAYVLMPAARRIERGIPWWHDRPERTRSVAVAVIFLAAVVAFAGSLILVVPPTIEQGREFADEFPELISKARVTVEGWVELYVDTVSDDTRATIEQFLADSGGIIGSAAGNIAQQSLGAVTGSLGFILSLATAPILVFYLIKDSESIRESLYAPFPAALHPHLRSTLEIADRTLGGYLRGQLTLGAVIGAIVTVGLLLLDIPFALLLGIVAGLTELIPLIGPFIGGAAGVLVTLATEPDKVLWVLLFYVAIQLVENTLLAPRIQAKSLNMHPIAVILVFVLGSYFFGLWGVILGPPLVAMGRDIIVYFHQQWNADSPTIPENEPEPAAENPEAE